MIFATSSGLADTVMISEFWGNPLLAGAGAIYGVAWLHPIRRGAWWRAGVAFVFAFMIAFGFCLGRIRNASAYGYYL